MQGPLLIIYEEDDLHHILSVSEGKIKNIPCHSSEFEPDDVSCVFRGIQILPGVVAIKSYDDHYLGCDILGNTAINLKAIGPSETWSIEFTKEGKIGFKNRAFGGYISFDSMSQSLRADSKEIGINESFFAKCQSGQRNLRRQMERDKHEHTDKATLDPLSLEKEEIEKFHSYNRLSEGSKNDMDTFKAALKKGRLREVLLERRIRQKHDKFC